MEVCKDFSSCSKTKSCPADGGDCYSVIWATANSWLNEKYAEKNPSKYVEEKKRVTNMPEYLQAQNSCRQLKMEQCEADIATLKCKLNEGANCTPQE
jgi:hypothetical protein